MNYLVELWDLKEIMNVKLYLGQCLRLDCVLVTRSCPTLCDHMDYSPPDSSVHGLLKAKLLEWVAMLFSRGSSQSKVQSQVSCIAGRFFTS